MHAIRAQAADESAAGYPENPVLVRVWRGDAVESVHRGAWVLVDGGGRVLAGAGSYDSPFYARSSVKSLQALPLLETGAADRFAFEDEEIALALASHSGEACHTERVAATLARIGLDAADLACGVHPPQDFETRRALERAGRRPTALHNNCSGKHAGFLALARHLGVDTRAYLDPASEGQVLVRAALSDLTGAAAETLVPAIDGCSAPTYRLPLRGLATAFARLATPDGLAPGRRRHCERMLGAVARHPVLLAGSHKRLCTDLVRASAGRLFPKIGAEAVYAIGVRGGDRGLAVKLDDGGARGLFATVLAVLERHALATGSELAALDAWRRETLENFAGLTVGRLEPTVE